jgi:hypothetical protein
MNKDAKEVCKRLNKVIRYTNLATPNNFVEKNEFDYIETNMELIDILLDHHLYTSMDDIVDKCIQMIESKLIGMLLLNKRLKSSESDIGTLQNLPTNILDIIRNHIMDY